MITDEMRRDAYRQAVGELGEPEASYPRLGNPVVDAAVRYVLGLPNSWELIVLGALAPFLEETQRQLWAAAQVLMTATADWDDYDASGLSVSRVRIEEICVYVDEANAE